MPQNMMSTAPNAWRNALWLGVLVAASVAFTFGFACAVPFAAFGAATALTLNPRNALLLTAAMWLANQLVGFMLLDYPWDATTFTWGGVLGIVAVLSTMAARVAAARFDGRRPAFVLLASFAAAFVAYEGSLYIVSAAWLGGTEYFATAIVVRILEINAAGFVGLLALNRFGMAVGLTSTPTVRFATARHA